LPSPTPITSAISSVLWCFSTLRSFCACTTSHNILKDDLVWHELQAMWRGMPAHCANNAQNV
jgi:hypothetical protein